jgi:hypothetical protein
MSACQRLHHADPANIVGPPCSRTKISASIAACHDWRIVLGLWQFGDAVGDIVQRDQLAAATDAAGH